LTVAFELGSTFQVIAFACGAVVAVVGLAGGALVTTAADGDGVAAPPHALAATMNSASAATRLGTGTFTNTHDPHHLWMHPAVICEYTHPIECKGRALVAVDRDIERASRIIRGDRVELLAAIHERHRCASGDPQLLRGIGPFSLLAGGLDDLDLVGARCRCHACATARGQREKDETGGGAEYPARDHQDTTSVDTARMYAP
jgi:hypothetical protein